MMLGPLLLTLSAAQVSQARLDFEALELDVNMWRNSFFDILNTCQTHQYVSKETLCFLDALASLDLLIAH